jgi:CHAT domain-containing protein
MVDPQRREIDAAKLARDIDALRSACERGDPDWAPLADGIAEILLEPFDAVIAGHANVVFVPYGAAHELPFGLLPWRGAPLIAARTVSTLPSLSALKLLSGRRDDPAPQAVLAVGNPSNMSYRPPGATTAAPQNPLPGAAAEAEYVASLFPGSLPLVGPAATEEAVRERIGAYRLLHFATHGLLEQEPLLSCLLLAEGQALTVYELIGLDVDADVVVLSACRTGQGQTTGGEEVLGLTRALLGAGAGAAVVSLWPVDDDSTSLLMGAFYERLRETREPAAALRAAQEHLRGLAPERIEAERDALRARVSGGARDILADTQPATADLGHPYHWAPFVVVGADRLARELEAP